MKEATLAEVVSGGCSNPFVIPVSDDNRGLNAKDVSHLGDSFNAKDRADQDRYLASEFRGLGVQIASQEARLQKDNVDGAHWHGNQYGSLKDALCGLKFDVATAIERNGRSAELATEKTAAATILAIEKTAAAAALAAAECCCELRTAIAAEGEKNRALVSQIDRERLQAELAVYKARALAI